ncbi:MAG: LptF/LptG family permease [Candidatus Marinimicrobia bacterium]|nr:LptF/LptG family permease [Candidatus Neomarinimicrobiota bacterium]
MKLLNRYLIREHFSPFLMALLVLLFVLLANFLLRKMDRFLGKGLEFSLIIEFVFLNLAWILALAVPMAVLVATLMAFGRLSADNEIAAMRSVSVSYVKLMIPVLLFGSAIAGFMMYFNNQILPEMNHKARMLSSDISRKRPDLEFDVGYFIDAIPDYNFLLGSRDGEVFYDITIFSNPERNKHQTITAHSGTISAVNDGVILHLENGIIHEYFGNEKNEYQQIVFDKYQVMIPVDNLVLNRRDSSIRGDREMTYGMLQDKITSYKEKIVNTHNRIQGRLENEAKKLKIESRIDSSTVLTLASTIDRIQQYEIELEDSLKLIEGGSIERVKRRLKNMKRGVESDFSLITSFSNSINKYLVELHKKFSIPFASVVFILIGAPLGMMVRKGGFAVSMAFSLSFFVIYWAFLIGGEEFADRGFLSPALSMWLPNIVLGVLGLYMCYRQSLEQQFLSFDLLTLFKRKNRLLK